MFSMTQDQSAIILENLVSIYKPNAHSAAAYRNMIKVVSDIKESDDHTAFWLASEGEKLKEETTILFAQSLDIAMNEAANGPSKDNDVQQTFRYREGGSEKMERGQLISQHCNRLLIKNLKGWLMSIPVAVPAAGLKHCVTSTTM